MGKDFLLNTLFKPLLQRLGTVAATFLVAGGDWLCRTYEACGLVTDGGAALVLNYVVAAALLAAELAWVHIERMTKGRL